MAALMPQLLIVTDGLLSTEHGHAVHPLLDPWQKQLLRCSRSWYDSDSKTALEWYAALQDMAAADIFAAAVKEQMPGGAQQVWIASPYHARLLRDQIRVMPDALLPWSEQDARWICKLLNPLLREERVELLHHHAALLLVCDHPIDAMPVSFARVSGSALPNRHPDGADGGRLMRLMAEIQMVLNLEPAQHRRVSGEPDVHGLWIWGGHEVADDTPALATVSVATRNPLLMSLADAKDAALMITDAEQLPQLVQAGSPLPKHIVLAGQEKAVLLKPSLLPRFGKASWQPGAAEPAERLTPVLRSLV
ncbi:MAG: threonine synthase [Mariprofundaceae bacterium]|nr:threonine synthase [Mariprofundaceae bacterium]